MPYAIVDRMDLKSTATDVTGWSSTNLKGLWLAKIWIVAPAIICLPVMWIFGEGDYIVPILGILWIAAGYHGLGIRQRAPKGTVRRSLGFWICVWSFILAAMMLLFTIGCLIENNWRWTPPNHGWFWASDSR